MNQDMVKKALLRIADCQTEFTLIFSGKESKLVDGLYKPATREIIIHNRNFSNDDQLMYTAIHEYAHHLHAERKNFVTSGKAHTNEFWGIFEDLLVKAEHKKIYKNIFESNEEFTALTKKIKESCLAQNGELMLKFGKLILEAQDLCNKYKMCFEDYLDRALGIPRTTAITAAKATVYKVDASIGWDGMKMATTFKDPKQRAQAVSALKTGMSPAAVKANFSPSRPSEDPTQRLLKEKERLARTIRLLEAQLAEVEAKLGEL